MSKDTNILPGKSLKDFFKCAEENKFSKLAKSKSLSIYKDHQLVISKQAEKDFEELLLENTELFKLQLPG